MASEWYYTLNGQQAPMPASPATLKQLALAGRLLPTDLVWQEGMPNWMPASSVKGLFGSGRLLPAEPADVNDKPRESRSAEAARAVPAMHPVLVLLLSVCTGGLFGLFYAYSVCRAYSARANQRETDSSGRPLGRIRHPLGVLILSYLTFGFYFYYHASMMLLECDSFLGRKEIEPRTELTLMLLFPPYAVFVCFRLPELIRSVQQEVKIPESLAVNCSWVFLNPCLFFALPLLSMAYQDALNRSWRAAP